jgi:hypothetical protein
MEKMVRRHYHASVTRQAIQEGLFAILEEDLEVHLSVSGDLGLYLSPGKSEVVMTALAYGRLRDSLEAHLRKKQPGASDAEISALMEKLISNASGQKWKNYKRWRTGTRKLLPGRC